MRFDPTAFRRWAIRAAAALIACCGTPLTAQPYTPSRAPDQAPPPADDEPESPTTPRGPDARARAGELESRAVKAYSEGRLADAEKLLREQLELVPGNHLALYNLACTRAAQGDHNQGMELLVSAIEHGFDDLREIQKDNALAPLRNREEYKRLIENWPSLLEARRDANVESVTEYFVNGYRVETDDRLRLVFVSAVDERSTAVARKEIALLGEWASREIFPGILDKPGSENDPWVVVVLPTREDFVRWISSRHGGGGGGLASIGGEYDHDAKILVSQDLGSSLRHEFFHVLHWRSCMRLGQRHPIWVQEGLCSLVEDYTLTPDGKVQPQTSWRSNIVKRLERIGQLKGIHDLCTMDHNRFMSSRVLASYARARTSFLFLSDRGKLGAWYEAFTATYAQDPTGVKAWESTLGLPVQQIDVAMRGWVRDLPMVPEEIKSGMASLGVEVESGGADGLLVTSVLSQRRRGPLSEGDVIIDIDGKSTRDIAELVRVLGGYSPGDIAQVGVRRGKRFRTEKVTLSAKP